jgi:hypothetical protein
MVRLREWKLIVRKLRGNAAERPEDELINLATDPGETENRLVLPEDREKLQHLARLLVARRREIGDAVAVELGSRYIGA